MIGAGCKLGDNITVGKESVLGCGATLISDLKEKSLAVGRPAKIIRNIEKSGTKHKTIFTETQMNMIYNHIKNLNYGKFPKEFDNMLNCNDFNTMAGSLKYLFRLTKVLCDELNEDISDKRRNEIYDILFIKPKNIKIKIGKNLHVDMLGTIIINGDIIIGDNVSLGGNIVIEGNTVINSGSILHASGHSLLAKERLMSFSLKKGFYENSIYGCISKSHI